MTFNLCSQCNCTQCTSLWK